MKVAIITCYDQSDYIRAHTIRAAFAKCEDVEVLIIKNRHKGLLRYLEVPAKIIKARFTEHLDAYVVTFRGYEMLLFLRLTFVAKPIIFDELVNFVEYYEEHHILKEGTFLDNLMRQLYHWQVARCRFILADTGPHAELSAKLSSVPKDTFRVLPIAADEQLFYPRTAHDRGKHPFTIFFYGNGMTPLHGLQYVIDAAILLKDNDNVMFNLVGGHDDARRACEDAVTRGAHIQYEAWIPFKEIPDRVRKADLCLGGPFGKTLQSQYVVGGKTTQALASASPVLIGENKLSNLFKDKVDALIVPPADAHAIVKVITWATEHPKELERIGLAGRTVYEQYFAERIVQEQVQQMVEEIRA